MSESELRRTGITLFRTMLILPFLRGEYPPGGEQRLREENTNSRQATPHSSGSTVSPPTLARGTFHSVRPTGRQTFWPMAPRT